MSYLRILGRKAAARCVLVAGWLAATATWAQAQKLTGKEDATTTATGPYVWAYMLLILGLALGLLVVCRSANRRDRARPEDYVETGLHEEAGPAKGKK